jgi:polyisoprenyl-phosphate glycosyltransferase
MRIVIAMPIYEDWDSAIELCKKIDVVLRKEECLHASLLLIDDGSTVSTHPDQFPFCPEVIDNITALVLRRNLGHQRAIAIALAYIQQHWKGDAVVVMDADGEDPPEDIPRLVGAMKNIQVPTAVFAERGKRLESVTFRIFYNCYRAMHRLVTGRDIRFGNFSVLPWSHLDSLVVFPELWNHYAATFIKSRLPYARVRSDRAARLTGQSHMNFVSFIGLGLSALFANQEVVGTRLLIMSMFITLGLLLLAGAVAGIKFFTQLAIPGWATTTIGLLFILVGQSVIASFMLVFSIMMNRSQLGFLPIRDYSYFVRRETTLYSR